VGAAVLDVDGDRTKASSSSTVLEVAVYLDARTVLYGRVGP